MTDRTFFILLNLDAFSAEMAGLDSTQERGEWVEGFQVGSHGHGLRESWSDVKLRGHQFGFGALREAEAHRDKKVEAGRRSAQVRKDMKGSAQPERLSSNDRTPFGGCSEHPPEQDPEHTPNHPITNNQQPITKTQHPTTSTAKGRKPPFRTAELDHLIPAELQSVAFMGAWHEWTEFAQSKSKRVPERSAKAFFEEVAQLGEKAGIDAIRNSIRCNWTGLFPKAQLQTNGRKENGSRWTGFGEIDYEKGLTKRADGTFML
jgi:hypothetical protein